MNDNSSPNQKHGRFEALQGEPIVPSDAAEETAVDYPEAVPLTDECSKEGQPEETHPHYQGRFAAKHRQSADEATEMAGPEAPVIPERPAEEDGANPEIPFSPESPAEEACTPLPTEETYGKEPIPAADPILPPPQMQWQEPEPEESISPAPQPEKRRRAVKKGRPRRRKGEGLLGIPNILATGVWVALTILIGVTLGRIVWVCASEILAFGREDKVVTITVYDTDTIDDITQKLVRNELIHYPGLFKLYAKFAVDDGDIKPGIWDLNTKYD